MSDQALHPPIPVTRVHTIRGEVCGNCKFARPVNTAGQPHQVAVQMRDKFHCWGAPPSVHVMVIGRGPDGQPITMSTNVRPVVELHEPGCGSYKPKIIPG